MDCGHRLKAAQAAVQGDTAVSGTAFLMDAPPPSQASRPMAPDFEFAPRPVESSCARCGTRNPTSNRYCMACGEVVGAATPLPTASQAPSPCPRCQQPNDPGMRFCKHCGAALQGAEVEALSRAAPETQASLHAPEQAPQHAHPAVPEAPRSASQHPPAPAYPAPAEQPPALQYLTPQPSQGVPSQQPAPATVPQPGVARMAAGGAPVRPSERPGPVVRGKLVVISQDGSPGREYPIYDEQVDIGRQEGTIVLPNDPYVSPRHARVLLRDGQFTIRDLGSLNGVFVRLTRTEPLRNSDLLLVGLEVLRFEVVSEAEAGLGQAIERGTQVFGSPIAQRFARLSQRTVEGVTRDVYHLTRDQTVIGREAGDIVFTTDPFMSRRHAGITRGPSGRDFSLRDLGSSNGTYLAIRGEQQLADGDHVRIGQHLFRLETDRATKLI